MNEQQARYWRRFLDGKELVPYDQGVLLSAMEADPLLAGQLASERGIDAMLRMATRAQNTVTEFVGEVTERALAEAELGASTTVVLEAEPTLSEIPASENRPLPPVRRESNPVEPPPLAPQVVPLPLAQADLQMPVSRVRKAKEAAPVDLPVKIRRVAYVLAGTAAILGVVLAGMWWGRSRSTSTEHLAARRPEPPAVERSENPPPSGPELPQPNLTALPANNVDNKAPERADWQPPQLIPAVWIQGGPRKNQLPPGLHELSSGRSRVQWKEGTRLEIVGPARLEMHDDGTLMVWRGNVRASDVDAAAAQTTCLMTPVARVPTHAAEFEVNVQENGNTKFDLVDGELRLTPGVEESAAPLRLAASELDGAEIERAPQAKQETLVFARLSGPNDRFRGVIQLEGAALQFGGAAEFDKFRGQVLTSVANEPEKLLASWPDLVRSLQGVGGAALNLERGGEMAELRSLEELLQSLPALPAAGAGSFSGSITIDGQEMKFNSPAEFEAARKKLLAPFDLLPPAAP